MKDYLRIVNEWGKDESSFGGCEMESFEDFNENCVIELGIEANDELYQSYVDGYRIGWTDKEMDDRFGEW